MRGAFFLSGHNAGHQGELAILRQSGRNPDEIFWAMVSRTRWRLFPIKSGGLTGYFWKIGERGDRNFYPLLLEEAHRAFSFLLGSHHLLTFPRESKETFALPLYIH